MTSHGYSPVAAAGIEGNVEQESGGDPTAGTNPPGAGLIQELGDPGGSLASEEQVILNYNNQQGAGLINSLNQQTDPAQAALFYSQYFERPLASAANNANREQSAVQVYQAAQSGNWPSGSGATPAATTTGAFGIPGLPSALDPVNWVKSIGSAFGGTIKDLLERGGLIVLGFALVILGIHLLASGGGGSPITVNTSSKEGPTGSTSKRSISTPVGKHETTKTIGGTGASEAVEAAAVA